MDTAFRHALIAYVATGSLKPSLHNARTHSLAQKRAIAASIRKFGFVNPVIIDHTNHIVAGHGRWLAAKELGLTDIPAIRIEHLSDDEIRAYIIADNRLAELAGWDESILAVELQHLALQTRFDVTVTGFEIPEIDLIIGGQAAAADEVENTGAGSGKTDDEGSTYVETGPAVTRPGDFWQLGRHRLGCADALEADSYRLLMDNRQASLVFTDPPYNVAINGHVSGRGRARHREFPMATGEMDDASFIAFLKSSSGLLAEHTLPGAIHFVCMDWRHAWHLLEATKDKYSLLNVCVWVKHNAGMGSLYRSQHEFVFVFRRDGAQHRNNVRLGKYGRNRTNVWQYPGANNFGRPGPSGELPSSHPTVKPVQMVADAILDCSARNDVVLDPFLGSGTTLIAAERTGRICYGLELDALYVDAIVRRWQHHTAAKAVHLTSGKEFDANEADGPTFDA